MILHTPLPVMTSMATDCMNTLLTSTLVIVFVRLQLVPLTSPLPICMNLQISLVMTSVVSHCSSR